MEENWHALAVSILKWVSPEAAFKTLETGKLKQDVMSLIEMKKSGMTYQQVANVFGITANAVYRRIKRFKEKQRTEIQSIKGDELNDRG